MHAVFVLTVDRDRFAHLLIMRSVLYLPLHPPPERPYTSTLPPTLAASSCSECQNTLVIFFSMAGGLANSLAHFLSNQCQTAGMTRESPQHGASRALQGKKDLPSTYIQTEGAWDTAMDGPCFLTFVPVFLMQAGVGWERETATGTHKLHLISAVCCHRLPGAQSNSRIF